MDIEKYTKEYESKPAVLELISKLRKGLESLPSGATRQAAVEILVADKVKAESLAIDLLEALGEADEELEMKDRDLEIKNGKIRALEKKLYDSRIV